MGALLSRAEESVKKELILVLNAAVAGTFLVLGFERFFWEASTQTPTVATLLVLGATLAVMSRTLSAAYAYAAAICFLGAGVVLLRHLHVPLYKCGYSFVPIGLICLLRAWTFERSNRAALANLYFYAGHLALVGSLLAILPTYIYHGQANLGSLLGILLGLMAVYSLGGGLYRQSFYTYAGGAALLFVTWTLIWHRNADFSIGVLFFTATACLLLLAGFIGEQTNEEQIGAPLTLLGLGTLSLAIALLAGKWGNQFLTTGKLLETLPPDQISAGLWTGGLSTLAYAFLAAAKKRVQFLYAALFSGTWVYIMWLEKIHWPIHLLNMSWVVAVSMIFFYILHASGKPSAARAFALWGEIMTFFIAAAAVISPTPIALKAVAVSTLSMLPSVWIGDSRLVFQFLMGTYLFHFLWFRQVYSLQNPAEWAVYALQLIAVNLGVVCLRTAVTLTRPDNSIEPYRIFAFFFSIVSLGLALFDFQIAWQVYLCYGLLALAVSYVHYQGRYIHVGTILLLISCELFLYSRDIIYVEAYTFPVAMYILAFGYAMRERKDLRDFLYGASMVILYLPSSIKAMNETWEWHGIFLGVSSLLLMLFGIHQRNKFLTFGSLVVLLVNGSFQSHQFFLTVPRWIYLGLGGITLIALGGLFEFQRETLINMKQRVADSFEEWD
jgi:hypothetical protein